MDRQPLSLEWTWMWPTHWEPAYSVHVAALVPLLIACVVAAVIDWKRRKIPNWLTFALLGGGVVRSFVTWATGSDFTPIDAFAGIGAAMLIGVPLFMLKARGAGDAKLYISAGAWIGWQGVIVLAALEAIVGLFVVVGTAAATGRLKMLLKNTMVLLTTFLHLRRIGMEQATTNAERFTIYGKVPDDQLPGRFTSVAKPLPHAVPFLIAAVLAIFLGRL